MAELWTHASAYVVMDAKILYDHYLMSALSERYMYLARFLGIHQTLHMSLLSTIGLVVNYVLAIAFEQQVARAPCSIHGWCIIFA